MGNGVERLGVARVWATRFGMVTVFLLVVSLLLTVTPDRAEAQSYNFTSVDVQGNQRVDASTVLSYANLPRGTAISAADLNDAYQRIAGSGLFERVELAPRGGRLVIIVQEFPTINRIAFEGNKRLETDLLTTVVQSKPRRVYSPAQAEADAQLIAQGYLETGRLAATVVPKIIRRSDNRVDLVFEITEGKVAEVERVSFVGNRTYSESRLRRVLSTKQAGLFRAFIKADTLIEDRIVADRQLLTDFYRSRGYIDFQVLSAVPELVRDRSAFLLTFTVREGQQYRVGAVSVTSEIATIDASGYQAQVKLKPGVVYSPSLIENEIARLERLSVQQAENFVRVEPKITRNDATLTLDIEFHLSRGPRVFVERIDIEGNTQTLDRVVRREFDTVEGDPFNPRAVRASAERIRSLGYFGDANVRPREGSSPDQVILDVDVEEVPTGNLGFGASYSTDSGLGFTVSFSERNFLGRGQSFNLDVATTDATLNFGLGFVEPAFLGRDVALGLNLSYRGATNDNTRYSTDRGQFAPSLSFPLNESIRLSLRTGIDYARVKSVDRGFPDDSTDPTDTGSSAILRAEEDMGGLAAVSLGYSLSYDSRALALDPSTGLFFRISQDVGFREDEASYIRSEFLLRARKAVLNEDVTLRAEVEFGGLRFFDGDSRITDRYTLNGKIRGFESNGLGPRDLSVSNEDSLGGNLFAVARFEAEFPLGLPEEYGLTGGVFYDIGSVWSLDNLAGGPGGLNNVDDSMHLRSAIGLSVFWDTFLGPLRFNFAHPLMKQSYDKDRTFEFTLSTKF